MLMLLVIQLVIVMRFTRLAASIITLNFFKTCFQEKKILNDVCPILNLFFFRFADEVVCESSVNSAL